MNIAVCIYGSNNDSNMHPNATAALCRLSGGGENSNIDYFTHQWPNNTINEINPQASIIEESSTKTKIMTKLQNDIGTENSIIHSPEWYSLMRVVHLKRQRELETSRLYDVCVALRSDSHIVADLLRSSRPCTVYIRQPTILPSFPYSQVDHRCFYADSMSMDKLSQFYRLLPTLGNVCLEESLFFFYIKMINLDIAIIHNAGEK